MTEWIFRADCTGASVVACDAPRIDTDQSRLSRTHFQRNPECRSKLIWIRVEVVTDA
jgi:hypothetical protein